MGYAGSWFDRQIPDPRYHMQELIGKRFGTWVVDKELGRGGMGRVFLVHEELPGNGDSANSPRLAAVKVLSAELAQEVGFLERFQREIDVLEQLSHPHIVRFYESGFQEGHYYYVMEYLPGKNFDELLHEHGRLEWKEVLDIALQICPALKHAHDHGIIHRDIKPQNLLRAEDGTVKLTDFGIAKVFAGKQLTITGGLVGTAEFLSPEQAGGKPVTNRSDLYSFGVVLYTLLTGRTPFHGRSTLDLMHKHRFAQFDPPQRVVPDIPHDLDKIICDLLEKEPSKRPANGLVLLRQFETLRNKVHRREQRTIASNKEDGTQTADDYDHPLPRNKPGPATLMSQWVREELASQHRRGPIAKFVNRPLVLVTLFLACLTFIVWFIWLPAPGSSDADKGFRVVTPGEQFFQHGKQLYRDGKLDDARQTLEDLVKAFAKVGTETTWVNRAKDLLAEIKASQQNPHRWDPLFIALDQAEKLKRDGKSDEANEKVRSLQRLYQNQQIPELAASQIKRILEMNSKKD
jgi:serine/threonine-protein kinase